ncbi:hypothetical protein [Cellulomonas sp. SLBN-39]|uniref:hypothetical protein n=1 Tax=Cellulomonas sp. SLBN-39 TaxID=2768446 RepID=UPI00114EFD86|nr:hypothetical protein [Cellulomonas sp. SLBN-39]TQL03868.1 hypothetical protein FBY24_2976 [Cellulomonas sp. SLBN-39]
MDRAEVDALAARTRQRMADGEVLDPRAEALGCRFLGHSVIESVYFLRQAFDVPLGEGKELLFELAWSGDDSLPDNAAQHLPIAGLGRCHRLVAGLAYRLPEELGLALFAQARSAMVLDARPATRMDLLVDVQEGRLVVPDGPLEPVPFVVDARGERVGRLLLVVRGGVLVRLEQTWTGDAVPEAWPTPDRLDFGDRRATLWGPADESAALVHPRPGGGAPRGPAAAWEVEHLRASGELSVGAAGRLGELLAARSRGHARVLARGLLADLVLASGAPSHDAPAAVTVLVAGLPHLHPAVRPSALLLLTQIDLAAARVDGGHATECRRRIAEALPVVAATLAAGGDAERAQGVDLLAAAASSGPGARARAELYLARIVDGSTGDVRARAACALDGLRGTAT